MEATDIFERISMRAGAVLISCCPLVFVIWFGAAFWAGLGDGLESRARIDQRIRADMISTLHRIASELWFAPLITVVATVFVLILIRRWSWLVCFATFLLTGVFSNLLFTAGTRESALPTILLLTLPFGVVGKFTSEAIGRRAGHVAAAKR